MSKFVSKASKYWMVFVVVAVAQAFSQAVPEKKPAEKAPYLRHATISENAGTIQVVANSPRPLAQALDALQEKYGWLAGYEDPRFISPSDLTEPASTGAQIFPSGGAFKAEIPASVSDEEKFLQILADAYNGSENPGRFVVRKTKQGTFTLIGTQAKDAQGHLSPQKPMLDTPVTLLASQRTVTDTIDLISKKIAEQRSVKITLGVSPRAVVDHTKVKVGGTKVSARELLLQILSQLQGNFYWRLLFDPNSKGYVLDLHLMHPKK
jgi:hypothetical protein